VQWRSIATFVTLNGLGVTALFLDGEFQEPERHAPGSAKQFVQDISKDNLRPTSAATKPTEAISSSSVSQLLCVLKTERGEQCDEHAEETRLETDAELYKRNVAAELVRESETEGCGQHCDMPTLTLEHNPTLFDQEGRIALHAQWVRSRKSSALLIGCGPSVNLLSKEQYEKLREHADVWTINQVFFHPFIQPDYAHVELHSKEQVPVWKENLGQKWPKATFIIEDNWNLWREPFGARRTFTYRVGTKCPEEWAASNGGCQVGHGRYRVKQGLVNAICCSSLNRVMDILSYMPYHTVYMLGFDSLQRKMFFDEGPLYSQTNIMHDTKHAERVGPATTYEMAENGIEKAVSAFGVFNGMRLVNLATESRFATYIHTQSIDSAINELLV